MIEIPHLLRCFLRKLHRAPVATVLRLGLVPRAAGLQEVKRLRDQSSFPYSFYFQQAPPLPDQTLDPATRFPSQICSFLSDPLHGDSERNLISFEQLLQLFMC
jgi:hypothetical protein